MRIFLALIVFLFSTTGLVAQTSTPKLEIAQLTGDFYIFKTFNFYKGERISANGMYLVTGAGVVLFDTPWDTTQFQPLLDSINLRHHKKVTLCIATHFHADRTGGLEYYKRKGIATYTSLKTDVLSKQRGMNRAAFLLHGDTTFKVGAYIFQTYFAGAGHTSDNIVIWFEKEKLLYASCLVKSMEDNTLGNLADADVKAYGATIRNLQRKFVQPKYVIPGHNDWKNPASLSHTLKMAEALR
ncbi:MAG: BlaB/IND/MUS family subclass B1 metallo-beta-lactamase [Ferruginibacter sp.]|nr:BlaB/IND/MUS family subclass B1 metallo-beta-lactamase [Ferruginibacter sp.]